MALWPLLGVWDGALMEGTTLAKPAVSEIGVDFGCSTNPTGVNPNCVGGGGFADCSGVAFWVPTLFRAVSIEFNASEISTEEKD